jgi:hypothetical protein
MSERAWLSLIVVSLIVVCLAGIIFRGLSWVVAVVTCVQC